MLQAIIFDMDGTMVNTESYHARASLLALQKLGLTHQPSSKTVLDVAKKTSGTTNLATAKIILEEFNLPYSPEKLVELKAQKLMKIYVADQNLSLCPGLEALIRLLHNKYSLAVASSSPIHEIQYITKRFLIQDFFKTLVSGDELPRSKPFPDIFLETAKRLNIAPKHCMVFEDSYNGVKAAREAGMFVLGYNNPHTPHYDLSHAHIQISSYENLDFSGILRVYQSHIISL